MRISGCPVDTRRSHLRWVCVWLLLLPAGLRAAGPDTGNLVFYLPCDNAAQPVDASADPATIIVHGALTLAPGQFGTQGLGFNGNNANRLEVVSAPKLEGMSALSVEAWMFAQNVASHEGLSIASKRVANTNADVYNLFIWTGRLVNGRVNARTGANVVISKTAIQDNTWYHVAMVFDGAGPAGEKLKLYINGVLEASVDHPDTHVNAGGAPVWIGELDAARGFAWDGVLDEIGFWNAALTAEDVGQLMVRSKASMLRKGAAENPQPPDLAQDVPVDTDLAWAAGPFAATHDVYLGPTFADVNSASRTNTLGVLANQGQTATTYDAPGRLAYGQTYYWRIDEVNQAPDNTIYKGTVWSFTAEPYGYPVQPVAATASSSQVGMGPENTINGSGLDQNGLHGTEPTTMWMSAGVQPNWIQYEFDKAYKLYQLRVWNSNQLIESFLGFGAKTVTVETSLDGTTWVAVDNVPEFAQAPATEGYAANTTVNLGGVEAKYVKLTINSNWGGVAPQTGLAEVQFSYVPVQAREPVPTDGATQVGLDTDLTWRPGREAASHQVYFGTDPDAVAGGTAAAQTLTEHSYLPASLDFGTTYYWKVDEVNAVTYPGELWSFTTQEYQVIDDFESYTDQPGEEIFSAWIDGFTTGLSGSTVGYFTATGGTFGETAIVHGGRQSMPLQYDNTAAPFFSEAQRTFAVAQNWTTNGADSLVVYFRGLPPAFAETASGTILMNGIGADIWGTADQFRFAYQTLNGNGSMTARVDNLVNSNAWAKAGVMIRQSVQPGSVHAFIAATPGNSCSFQRRPSTGAASTSDNWTGTAVTAPYWVRITRTGNVFKAESSPDGTTWVALGTEQTITMSDPVLIGLALTSHDAAIATSAAFSNISTTGNVTGTWQVAEIGATQPEGNSVEGLYLAVTDSSGKTKVVQHPDPAATAYMTWQPWTIPLSDFTSAGVKTTAVKSLTLGVGNKAAPKAGGTGTVYIDDIGYGKPAK